MKSEGEKHRYDPQTIHMLQESTKRGDYGMFKQYTSLDGQRAERLSAKPDGL